MLQLHRMARHRPRSIGGEHEQHHRRLSLRRHPLSGRGRTHRSCVVSLQRLQASRRRADRRLDDVRRGCGQGDEGAAQGLRVLGTWPAALLRQLRHGPVLHQCEHLARDHRYSERDLRRPRCRSGDGAYPDRRAACTGWSARTNCPPSSAIRRRHSALQFDVQRRKLYSSSGAERFGDDHSSLVRSSETFREKTIRQRPDSDRPVLLQTRRKEKSSRRARIARDFSHRGDGCMHPSNFRIRRAHMDEVQRSKGYSP